VRNQYLNSVLMVDFLIMYTIRDYYYIWVEIDNNQTLGTNWSILL